jgi:hypothetical protein
VAYLAVLAVAAGGRAGDSNLKREKHCVIMGVKVHKKESAADEHAKGVIKPAEVLFSTETAP